MGELKRAISRDASVVSMALDATDIVREIESIHKTSAVVSAALGRLTIAASMMGYTLKGENDTVSIRMDGNGPAGMLIAVADSRGNVKSYVQNPVVEIPLNSIGKLDVRGVVGAEGTLSVVKDLGLKEPYSGTVPIVSGEIGEDIANYYASSEQVPTVCGLGVLVNPDLTIANAGGFLVQLLPFADDSCIDVIEKNISSIPPVTTMLKDGMTAEQIAMKLLEGLEPEIMDESEASYKCDCSRDRTRRILGSLGNEELENMAAENEDVKVYCNFCRKEYVFTPDEVLRLKKI